MALIIKADMPKACITGKLPNYDYCFHFEKCDKACGGDERPSDCPIIGEMPDEHGELIDRDFLLKYAVRLERKDGCDLIPVSELENAPTVVEASK